MTDKEALHFSYGSNIELINGQYHVYGGIRTWKDGEAVFQLPTEGLEQLADVKKKLEESGKFDDAEISSDEGSVSVNYCFDNARDAEIKEVIMRKDFLEAAKDVSISVAIPSTLGNLSTDSDGTLRGGI